MSPHQRARRPRRFSHEQLALRDIGCVPYLFGNEAACSCRIFHHAQQRLGGGGASSGKFVVGSFTGEQRPGAANSRAVERRTVLVLPVSVAVVAVPAWTLGKFSAQQFIDNLDRVHHSRIIGRAQAEAHQSQRIRTDDFHRPRF